MKTIRIISTLILGGLLFAGAGCKKGGPNAGNIEGKWVGTDAANPGTQYTLTVGDGKLDFKGANEKDSLSGTITTLYAEQIPGSIDVKVVAPPEYEGKMALMIFERKGDELQLAWEAPGSYQRPTDFTPGPGVRVFTLKPQ